jgi:hypothetical protein
MEPHVACSLDPAGAQSQLDEWRAVLGATVSSLEWIAPDFALLAPT